MFIIDPRLASSGFFLENWELSSVLLKNNSQYPWFILIPRQPNIRSIDMLEQSARYQLSDEIDRLSSFVQKKFKPDQINVAALGNIVPQLHIHIIGRFTRDPLWPESVWQAKLTETPYTDEERAALIASFYQGTQ